MKQSDILFERSYAVIVIHNQKTEVYRRFIFLRLTIFYSNYDIWVRINIDQILKKIELRVNML